MPCHRSGGCLLLPSCQNAPCSPHLTGPQTRSPHLLPAPGSMSSTAAWKWMGSRVVQPLPALRGLRPSLRSPPHPGTTCIPGRTREERHTGVQATALPHLAQAAFTLSPRTLWAKMFLQVCLLKGGQASIPEDQAEEDDSLRAATPEPGSTNGSMGVVRALLGGHCTHLRLRGSGLGGMPG